MDVTGWLASWLLDYIIRALIVSNLFLAVFQVLGTQLLFNKF